MIDLRARKELKHRFVIQDAAAPFTFARLFEEAVTTFSASHAMADWNMRSEADSGVDDPLALSDRKMTRSQFLLLIGHDDAGWRMQFARSSTQAGSGPDAVALSRVSLAPRRDDPSFESERARQRDIDAVVGALAGGPYGGRYVPNPLWAPVPAGLMTALTPDQPAPGGGAPASSVMGERSVTVHPLGGCRMANGGEGGVVNHLGQVFSSRRGSAVHKGLVVLDGSIVPTSLGINPLLTIAALAERACDALALAWGFEASDVAPAAVLQLPEPVAPLPYAHVPTSLTFREILKGGLQLAVDPVPPWPFAPTAAVRRDVLAQLTVEAHIDDLEALLRDPQHLVERAKAQLALVWYVAPAQPVDPARTGAADRDTRSHACATLPFTLSMLEMLPSNREERVWRAMRHWLDARGLAYLHDGIKSQLPRRIARWALQRLLAIEGRGARQAVLAVLEHFPLPAALGGRLRDEAIGLLKVASHQGEARALRYDLGSIEPPAANPWPFHGPVHVLAAKRLHYGDGPGYRQRPSLGKADPELPPRVPTQFWRTSHELQMLVLSQTEGDPLTPEDWPADQFPAGIDPGAWRVAARGTLTVNDVPLLTNDMPQLGGYRTLPDAWVDTASLAALVGRCFVQTSFWRLRLPFYPDPLPDAADGSVAQRAVVPDRTLGPLPGQVLAPDGARYVDQAPPGLDMDRIFLPVSDEAGAVEIALTRFRARAPLGGQAALEPVLLIHAFVTSGYMFATPRVKCNAVQAFTDAGFDTWVVDLRTSVALQSSHDAWSFDQVGAEDVPAAVRHIHATTGRRVHVIAQCMGSAAFNMAVLLGRLHAGGGSMVATSVQVQVSMDIVASSPNHMKAAFLNTMEWALGMGTVDVVADTRALTQKHRVAGLLDRLLWMWPTNDVDALRMADNSLELPRQTEGPGVRRITALYGRIFSWDNVGADVRQHLPELFRHASMRAIRHLLLMEQAGRIVDERGNDVYVTNDAIEAYYDFPVLFVHGQFATVFAQGTTRRSRIRLDRLRPGPRTPADRAAPARRHRFQGAAPMGTLRPVGQRSVSRRILPAAHRLHSKPGGAGRAARGPGAAGTPADVGATRAVGPFRQRRGARLDRLPQPVPRAGQRRRGGHGAQPAEHARPATAADLQHRDPARLGAVRAVFGRGRRRGRHRLGLRRMVDLRRLPHRGGGDLQRPRLHQGRRRPGGVVERPYDGSRAGRPAGPAERHLPRSAPRRRGRRRRGRQPVAQAGHRQRRVRPRHPIAGSRARPPADAHPRPPTDHRRCASGAGRHRTRPAPRLRRRVRLRHAAPGQQPAPQPARLRPARIGPGAAHADRVLPIPGDGRRAADGRPGARSSARRANRRRRDAGDARLRAAAGRPDLRRRDLRRLRRAAIDPAPAVEVQRLVGRRRGRPRHARADLAVRRRPRDPRRLVPRAASGERRGRIRRRAHCRRLRLPDGRRDRIDRSAPVLVRLPILRIPGRGARCPHRTRGPRRRDLVSRPARLVRRLAGVLQGRHRARKTLFVASSVPIFPFVAGGGTLEDRSRGDGWMAHPDSLAELVGMLVAAKVSRLVLLAGDPHLSHVARGTLDAGGHAISVCSIVSSALNAPLPSLGTARGAIVASWTGDALIAGQSFGAFSYDIEGLCDEDSAAIVDVDWESATGACRVHVHFAGTSVGSGSGADAFVDL